MLSSIAEECPTCYLHNSHVNTKESYLIFQRNTLLFIKFFLSGQLYKPWAVLCSPQWYIIVSWLQSASEEPRFQLSYLPCEKDNQTLYALHIALHVNRFEAPWPKRYRIPKSEVVNGWILLPHTLLLQIICRNIYFFPGFRLNSLNFVHLKTIYINFSTQKQ